MVPANHLRRQLFIMAPGVKSGRGRSRGLDRASRGQL